MFAIFLTIIADMNYFCRQIRVDPVTDKWKLYQEDTYAPPVLILQKHTLQKGIRTAIVHNESTLCVQ